MNKILILCGLQLCFALNLFSQSKVPIINSPVPVSPNAASIIKYGEIPVGYYTGIPSIDVPIYEIVSGSLKLPVGLAYHAGGLRVEEVASWIGTGWALNAGGQVSRQVRGIPDETVVVGYKYSRTKVDSFLSHKMTESNRGEYLLGIMNGSMDSQADVYNYNFGGTSGKFMYQADGSILPVPLTKQKIEFGNFLEQDSSWKITDENGVAYYFSNLETTYSASSNGHIIGSPGNNISTWYVTKIISPTNADTISFIYDGTNTQFNSSTIQTAYLGNPNAINCGDLAELNTDHALNTIVGFRLNAINFKNGSVKFYASSSSRDDYYLERALDSIVITSSDNQFHKTYFLQQSYNTTTLPGPPTTESFEKKRLFLDSIIVKDNIGKINSYGFTYDLSDRLPPRSSYSQDHWGYFNGASNVFFVPSIRVPYASSPLKVYADRRPNSIYNKLGILKSIKYPTGGYTEFEYETNKVANMDLSQDYAVGFPVVHGDITSGSFVIDQNFAGGGGTRATITVSTGGACATYVPGCPIVNFSGPTSFSVNTTSYTSFLPMGTYSVSVDLSGVTDSTILSNFSWTVAADRSAFSDTLIKYSMEAGGLRINKITDYAAGAVKATVKTYTYVDPDHPTRSSGYLSSFPNYIGAFQIDNGGACDYITVSSGSNYPLIATQGSYVGYKYVQEYLGENSEFGKKEYEFYDPRNFADSLFMDSLFSPSVVRDWKRGRLVAERTYRNNNADGVFELVHQKTNTYNDYETFTGNSLKVGSIASYSSGGIHYNITSAPYHSVSGWYPPATTVETVYDQTNLSLSITKLTEFGYGANHYQPISVRTVNSRGEDVIQYLKYPLDYTGLSGTDNFTKGISNLKSRNMIAPVIEKYTQVGTDHHTIQATLTGYKVSAPYPDKIYTTELPGATISFAPSFVSGGAIVTSGLYKPQVSFNRYDVYGNLAEQQKVNDAKHTYIWNYKGSYPVAEITNADSSQVASNSFEADGNGNWTGILTNSIVSSPAVPTGGKYYTLTGSTIQKTGLLQDTAYIISYWSNTGNYFTVSSSTASKKGPTFNGWTYCEHQVTGTGTVNITGTGGIDELRLYPKSALMTTYTYQPLAGISSQCDPANRITYYDYDALGRLVTVKDQKKQIIKTLKYHYKQ